MQASFKSIPAKNFPSTPHVWVADGGSLVVTEIDDGNPGKRFKASKQLLYERLLRKRIKDLT